MAERGILRKPKIIWNPGRKQESDDDRLMFLKAYSYLIVLIYDAKETISSSVPNRARFDNMYDNKVQDLFLSRDMERSRARITFLDTGELNAQCPLL